MSAAIIGRQGLRYLIDPAEVVAATTVPVDTVDQAHLLRAGFGGVLVAVAIAAFVAVVFTRALRSGLVVVGVSMGGLAGGRIVSLVVDGEPSDGLIPLLVVEVVLAVIGFVLLGASVRAAPDRLVGVPVLIDE